LLFPISALSPLCRRRGTLTEVFEMHTHDRADPTRKHRTVRRSHEPVREERAKPERTHNLVTLQRSLGNAQVARMLAQRQEMPEEEIMAKHDTAHGETGTTPEVGLEGGPISETLSSRINSKRGGGSALDTGTLERMEGAFGNTFGDVRVHTDSEADSLNRSVSAKAFTTGNDIFFSRHANPNDMNLLAHELTHVVQQRATPPASGTMTVGPAGDSHESAADAAASNVSSSTSVASAQRDEDQELAAIARQDFPEEEEEMA
jgi:hypothetical protein